MSRSTGCQITWDAGENLVSELGSGADRRRMSRGALRQKAACERMCDRFQHLGEGADSSHQQDTGPVVKYNRGEDGLDVFTSPFRALAESCGFKVICEDESSDGNSVISQAGSCGAARSLGSDVCDVLDKNASCTRGKPHRTRTRRGTPGPDVRVEGSISSQTDEDSCGSVETHRLGKVDQEWASRAIGRAVVGYEDGGKSGKIKRTKVHSAVNNQTYAYGDAALRPTEKVNAKVTMRDNNTHEDRGCRRNILHKTRKTQNSEGLSDKESNQDLRECAKVREKLKENRRSDSNRPNYASLDRGHQSESDSPNSVEERSSSDTYATVRQASSAEETDNKRSLSINNTDTRHAHRLRRCLNDVSSLDLNQSSRSTGQEPAPVPKPAAQRSYKIFMEALPEVGVSAATAREESKAGKTQPLVDHNLDIGCRGFMNSGENIQKDGYGSNISRNMVEQMFAEQANSKTDAQIANRGSKGALREYGGGAAFRISRKMTDASKSSKCGVMRYFRSGQDTLRNQPNSRRGEFCNDSILETYENDNRNKSAANIGAGDGHEENNVVAPKCKQTLLNKKDPERHGDITIAMRQGHETLGDTEDCRRSFEQGNRIVDKGPCIQNAKPEAVNEHGQEQETPKMQVLSEISKLRALAAAQGRAKSDGGCYGAVDRGLDAVNVTSVMQDRMLNQRRQLATHPQRRYMADQDGISCPDGLQDDNHKDCNIRECSVTDANSEPHGYIHLHGYTDRGHVTDPDLCHTMVDRLETNGSHVPTNHLPHHTHDLDRGAHKDNICYCQQGTQHDHGCSRQHSTPHGSTRACPQDTQCNNTGSDEQNAKHGGVHACQHTTQCNSTHFRQYNTPCDSTVGLCQQSLHRNDQPLHTDGTQEHHKSIENERVKHSRRADNCNCTFLKVGDPIPQQIDISRSDLSTQVQGDASARKEDDSRVLRPVVKPTCIPNVNSVDDRANSALRVLGTPSWREAFQTGQQPHHHKDFRFNVNSNYEGDEDGEGGVAGSRFIGQYFLELWKNQCLCDVRLRVGNWSYLAHKIVLAAFSDFFCPNDPHCMPSICFDIPNATPDSVHQILLYLYTSEMEITDYTLESVLCAAESLGVSEVINLVKEILENPTPENFEHYLEIRNRHGFSCRLTDYTELIREHLLDLTCSTHFLELDLCEVGTAGAASETTRLQQILGDPEVKVDSECDIIDVIARWVEYSPLERIAYSADLLSFVNFDCIPADSLADVVERKRNVFSRDAFSIFLDAFKTRSITAECRPCTPNQTLWNGVSNTGHYMLGRPTASATNKSTNADSYRPQQQQQQHQQQQQQPPLPAYDVGDNAPSSGMHARGLNMGGSHHLQDNFRSQQMTRRDGTSRIPRSSQGKISTLLSRPSSAQNYQPSRPPTAQSNNSWASDAGHSRPSTGMSSQGRGSGGVGGGPRRFATTQNRMATPREIMSMACKGDYDTSAWHRAGKQNKVSRGGGGMGGGGGGVGTGAAHAFREPARVPSDTALPTRRGRRGSVYRCSNGNAIFSPPSDPELGGSTGTAPPVNTGAFPVGGVNAIWEEGNAHTAPPTSPGWSRGSRGSSPAYSFVASPWQSPGLGNEAPPPGCSTFRVVRGGRGPRWEQRSRSPSVGHGSRDRSNTKRVTFM